MSGLGRKVGKIHVLAATVVLLLLLNSSAGAVGAPCSRLARRVRADRSIFPHGGDVSGRPAHGQKEPELAVDAVDSLLAQAAVMVAELARIAR